MGFPLFYCILGIFLLIRCGDWFVESASQLAGRWGMPKFLVGATIVSLATSLPEILVSLLAATQGVSSLAIGNAVGTVSANIGLILGISLLFSPQKIRKSQLLLQGFLLILTPTAIWIFGQNGLNALESTLILCLFVAFFWENIHYTPDCVPEKPEESAPLLPCLLLLTLGATGVALGSRFLVNNGRILAELFSVSPRIIAVTLVSVGTALPELVTTVTALSKGETALSVGNVLGASILDLTTILPLSSLISGGKIQFSPENFHLDLPLCLLLALVATLPSLATGRFFRWQGALLLFLYVSYLTLSLLA